MPQDLGGNNMSIQTSKTILKVTGILAIIFGVIGLIGAVFFLAGGSLVGAGVAAGEITDLDTKTTGALTFIAIFLGCLLLFRGIVDLLEGIFSLRAAKDEQKIMPAWVFSLIGLILSILSGISAFVTTPAAESSSTNAQTSVLSVILSIALSALIFYAANNIKKYVGK